MARYIDASKTVKEVKKLSKLCSFEELAILMRAMDAICDMPTEDVQEVKHGKWEELDYGYGIVYRCSECGEDFVTLEGKPAEKLWKYCPLCGARMDKDDKS